jgi:Tol biopolymer transport system component
MSENKSTGFWSSLPGLITALAGMITAIAVLVTTLVNLPLGGPSPTPTQAGTSVAPGGSDGKSGVPTGSPGSTSSPGVTSKPAATREIVFFSIRTDPDTGAHNPDVYAVNPRTGNERRLTNAPEPDSNPIWSPDGKRVAFDSLRDPGDRNVWVLEADGSYTNLTNDRRENAFAAWSPDGGRIAYSVGPIGSREIWVMDSRDGTGRRRLTTAGDDFRPSWGTNGLIAFTRKSGRTSEIWVVNPDDRATSARIPADEDGGFDPAWSPDGKRLAFARVVGGVPRIFIVNANGHSGLRQLTSTSTCDCILPTWSPDGTEIAYEGPGQGSRPIMIIPADGGRARRITTNGLAPRWGS